MKSAEQSAAADRAAITAFYDITFSSAARLLSCVVRRRRYGVESLSAEQWADIDAHIFRGYLPAVVRIREICGVGINEAKDIHWKRYKQLRAERNAEFTRTDEEYCAGILE